MQNDIFTLHNFFMEFSFSNHNFVPKGLMLGQFESHLGYLCRDGKSGNRSQKIAKIHFSGSRGSMGVLSGDAAQANA